MLQRMTGSTPIAPETATFPHAMLREIYEQPRALAVTIEHYVPGELSTAETFQPVVDALGRRERRPLAEMSLRLRVRRGRSVRWSPRAPEAARRFRAT